MSDIIPTWGSGLVRAPREMLHRRASLYSSGSVSPTEKDTVFIIVLTDPQEVSISFSQTVDGGNIIYWGDGTRTVASGTAEDQKSHFYRSAGAYSIVIVNYSGTINLFDGIINRAHASCIYPRSAIVEAIIGSACNTIKNWSFFKNDNLKKVIVNRGVTAYGTSEIASGSYPWDAIANCSNLEKVILPSNIKFRVLGNQPTRVNRFYNCYKLTSFGSIGSGCNVEADYGDVFPYALLMGNNTIQNVEINPDCKTISTYSFYTASAIENLTIPYGVSTIQSHSFFGSSIKSIAIPATVKLIDNQAMNYMRELLELVIPEGVTSLGVGSSYNAGDCFCRGNTKLSYVSLPSTLVTIPKTGNVGANFADCPLLTSFGKKGGGYSIEYAFTKVPAFCLHRSNNVADIVISNDVSEIGTLAFADITTLQTVHFKSLTPPAIASDAFRALLSTVTIYVPAGSLSAYQNTPGLSAYASQMVEE